MPSLVTIKSVCVSVCFELRWCFVIVRIPPKLFKRSTPALPMHRKVTEFQKGDRIPEK